MPNDNPQNGKNNTPIFLILLLITAVGGFYLYERPFESSRPQGERVLRPSTLGPESIQARLWQDPFVAVDKRLASGSGGSDGGARTHTIENLWRKIDQYWEGQNENRPKQIIVMPVMVYGSMYAESIEARRRRRYAVLSALSVVGYKPDEPEHIGYFRLPWPQDPIEAKGAGINAYRGDLQMVSSAQRLAANWGIQQNFCSDWDRTELELNDKTTLTVPYEWLSMNEALYPAQRPEQPLPPLIVLWLDDHLFSEDPLLRLGLLVHALHCDLQIVYEGKSFRKVNKPTLQFKIIGPAGSPTLHAMVQEAGKLLKNGNSTMFSKKIEIYSPTATASAKLLLGKDSKDEGALKKRKAPKDGDDQRPCGQSKYDSLEKIVDKFGKINIQFFRTIASDKHLARALCQELKRRNIEPDNEQHRIALIAEWDTYYGRTLPPSFEKIFREARRQSETNTAGEYIHCRSGICRYSYLRGLDGVLPDEKQAADDRQEKKDKKLAGMRDTESLERPVGDSQFDYLRRLAWTIERDLEANTQGEGGLKAIGILGSDVYDKLLVMQALRPLFPRALFFTTDLDSRYLHPAEYEWARNLIVASGFGLYLDPRWQAYIPPFRDSYQSSVYLAVQLALRNDTEFPQLHSWLKERLKPRLFEIGRHQLFDLTLAVQPNSNPVHPPWKSRIDGPLLGKWSLTFLFGAALLVLIFRSLRDARIWVGVSVAFIVPIILITALIYLEEVTALEERPPFEPFSLWGGVSVWPREGVMLIAGFLAVMLLIRARHALQQNEKDLSKRYSLQSDNNVHSSGDTDPNKKEVRHRWRRLEILFKRLVLPYWKKESISDNGQVHVQRLWTQYCYDDDMPHLAWRVALLSFLYGCFGLGLFWIFDSWTSDLSIVGGFICPECRGEWSLSVNRGILVFCAATFFLLLFYVVDTTRLCQQFIQYLTAKPSRWPKETLEIIGHQRGINKGEILDSLSDWLDVRLIAERTQSVGNIIYYPFVILFLVILAQSTVFDWNSLTPAVLIIIFLLNFAYATGCAFSLRNAAEKARQNSLDRMDQALSRAMEGSQQSRIDQIQLMIQEIKTNQEGAFRPISQQPIVKAILLPSGGIGGMVLLEYLAGVYV